MENYEWNNDDLQNNTSSDVTDDEIPDNNEALNEFGISENDNNKTDKKNKVNKFAVLSVVLTLCLLTSLGVLFCVMSKGSIMQQDKSDKMSQSLKDNLSSDENKGNGNGLINISTPDKSNSYSTPEIVDMVGPAVVGVINKTTYTNPFSYYYGYQQGSEIEQGSGSGVIISDDGYIVTNNHVIEGATEITVILNAGEEYSAKLIGKDSRTDLAVLKIEAEGLAYAKLGVSSDLRVGETAIAIGNPLGQEFAGTTTQGIISGLNRSITIDNKTMNLIQTDAAINPGNSGGALCNDKGLVIGINTAKISSSQYEGLGFAIPIDDAKPIIEDLILNGYVTGRPVIGIAGRAVTEQDAQAYNLKVGVYVSSMTADSPADMAGIKIGDIIYECEGVKIETVDDLNEIKNKHKVGDTLKMKIYRQGKTREVKLVLGEETPYTD